MAAIHFYVSNEDLGEKFLFRLLRFEEIYILKKEATSFVEELLPNYTVLDKIKVST